MANEETIKQAIAQAAVEATKATVLVINEEGRRQSVSAEHSSASRNNRHRTGPSLRQIVFNWHVKEVFQTQEY